METSIIKGGQTLQRRLKALRASLDMNQSEMADILGIQQASYSGIECGRSMLTSKQIQILSENFSVNLNWLLSGSGEMYLTEKLCA